MQLVLLVRFYPAEADWEEYVNFSSGNINKIKIENKNLFFLQMTLHSSHPKVQQIFHWHLSWDFTWSYVLYAWNVHWIRFFWAAVPVQPVAPDQVEYTFCRGWFLKRFSVAPSEQEYDAVASQNHEGLVCGKLTRVVASKIVNLYDNLAESHAL